MLDLKNDGITILKGFFERETIENLRESAKSVFKIQFKHFGYSDYDSDMGFKNSMVRLFNEQFDTFQNCGKLIQSGLIELYNIAYNDKLIERLKLFGLENPLVCTRPVMFFNHPELAKKEQYYKTPMHQDYPSMLASSDSVVVWIPLMDVSSENGAVIFYPHTHHLGPLTEGLGESGFAEVEFDKENYEKIQPKLEMGDIAIFSTLLVHESGDIKNDEIRWSCHFRYTNLNDTDFIERGFPSPYIYKSIA
jgi:hypothetical protein